MKKANLILAGTLAVLICTKGFAAPPPQPQNVQDNRLGNSSYSNTKNAKTR